MQEENKQYALPFLSGRIHKFSGHIVRQRSSSMLKPGRGQFAIRAAEAHKATFSALKCTPFTHTARIV